MRVSLYVVFPGIHPICNFILYLVFSRSFIFSHELFCCNRQMRYFVFTFSIELIVPELFQISYEGFSLRDFSRNSFSFAIFFYIWCFHEALYLLINYSVVIDRFIIFVFTFLIELIFPEINLRHHFLHVLMLRVTVLR